MTIEKDKTEEKKKAEDPKAQGQTQTVQDEKKEEQKPTHSETNSEVDQAKKDQGDETGQAVLEIVKSALPEKLHSIIPENLGAKDMQKWFEGVKASGLMDQAPAKNPDGDGSLSTSTKTIDRTSLSPEERAAMVFRN